MLYNTQRKAPHLNVTRGLQVARLAYALAKSRGDFMGAEAVARAKGWTDTADYVTKAASGPVDRTDGVGLISVFNDLDDVLRAGTILGRMTNARLLPFQTRAIVGTQGSSAGFIAEGAPAPVSEINLTAIDALQPLKAVGMAVVSSELLEVGIQGTQAFLANDITAGVRLALDRVFIDPVNVRSAISPGSILQDATRFDAAKTAAGIKGAIRSLVAAVTSSDNDLATCAWVMSPKLATFLSTEDDEAFKGVTALGGFLCGLPVIVSTACSLAGSPSEELLALISQDAVAAALSDGELSMSDAAAIQLSTTPANAAGPLVSLWQNNLVGFKTQVFADWRLRRSNGAAYAVLN
ncbi:hypothetical protein D621_05640 [beta proteobacterium AAP51]|nr:hypothetical protein D621_05640 [beta proteobacterium AAP51]